MTQAKTAEKSAQTTEKKGPEFAIQRLYLKDLSLETPNTPKIFLEKWEPQLHMDLATDASQVLDEGVREVVLSVTVTVKLKEKVAFLVEGKFAGIFVVKGFEEEQLKHMLGSYCPTVLYPYVREVITDAVMRAGFPQLYLAPMNFEALYQQQLDEAKKKKDGKADDKKK